MKQPPFEVADIIRKAGTRFIERYRGSLGWAQLKVLTAVHIAELLHSAAIAINAPAAGMKPSRRRHS